MAARSSSPCRSTRSGVGGSLNVRTAASDDFDGRFQFCRVVFQRRAGGDGGGWSVDFPRADINLSIRLAELTRTDVSRLPGGEPNTVADPAHRRRSSSAVRSS